MKTNWLTLLIIACSLNLAENSRLRGGPADPPSTSPPAVTPSAPKAEPPPRRRSGGRGWRRNNPNGKNNTTIKAAFREIMAPASAATVRILSEGKAVALGTMVDANGYLVSKRSLLRGKLICRFTDGRELAATIVGEDATNDLAVLHVDASGLPVVPWQTGALPPAGSIVAAVGTTDEPLGIGVISADLRKIHGSIRSPDQQGWLGVSLGSGERSVIVESIVSGSPAEKAEFKLHDQIETINGRSMRSVDQVINTVIECSPGDRLTVTVLRDKQPVKLFPTLGHQAQRSAEDDWGGGPFSKRRWGFPTVLPHDIPVLPEDCGGPLLDTDGKAIGINIARALRVSTFALPAETVQRLAQEIIALSLKEHRESDKTSRDSAVKKAA